MRGELEIQKSDGKQELRNARGLMKRFDLKELVEARLCRIVTGGDERGLKFEYDPNISNALVGSEKVLGELLTVVIGYSWDRLERGGLDVAVQGFSETDETLKVQFSFCENRTAVSEDDSLYQQRSFRNAEDDGSEFRMIDELCSQLGVEMVTLYGPSGEMYLAFVMQFAKSISNSVSRDEPVGTDCLKGKRLLLVEDNDLYREVLKGHMVQWGIEVAETGDAESAIEVLNAVGPFDFGVFDISLPGMSGEELAGHCRSQPMQSGMRIISLSGAQRSGLDDLFDERLVKPAVPFVLKELLTRCASGLS